MENSVFDIEEAELTLHNIENLIEVYTDFFGRHCTLETEWDEYTRKGLDIRFSVILAALDSIRRLRGVMQESINVKFAKNKRNKA
ncbi:MAG: hypothetical protein NC299_10630 [Lachnospiraceae bacterium]|nr:hypothetical protein [Ruminococcus sp.]MCM1275803.1 hypothetical protein [Lachnospiraceae bacterium]